jgi:hypothetical protein
MIWSVIKTSPNTTSRVITSAPNLSSAMPSYKRFPLRGELGMTLPVFPENGRSENQVFVGQRLFIDHVG